MDLYPYSFLNWQIEVRNNFKITDTQSTRNEVKSF